MKHSHNSLTSVSYLFKFICIVVLFSSSCSDGAKTAKNERASSKDTVSLETGSSETLIDSASTKIAEGDTVYAIAGKSIGKFQLKQEIEQARLFEALGKVDSGDAAMCKSWSMWYLDKKVPEKEFDVYSACDADFDMRKTIQILRLAGVSFLTESGISEKSSINQLKSFYPEALILEHLESPSSELVTLFDDVSSGIAFELINNKITAVVVHKAGEELTDTYLPFYKHI